MEKRLDQNVIQLVKQNENGDLVINEKALELIEELNYPIGVIITVGKKRLGKSFMLNRLLDIDCQNGFEISHIDELCTKGIYMFTNIINYENKSGDRMNIILLDTQVIIFFFIFFKF